MSGTLKTKAKDITIYIALCLLAVFLLFLLFGLLSNKWYQVLPVSGGSMSPTIKKGDLILITRPREPLEPGTIVTFQVEDKLVTHRLVEITPEGYLITQGDANKAADTWVSKDGIPQHLISVGGIYQGRIRWLGYLFFVRDAIFGTGAWVNDPEALQNNVLAADNWIPDSPTGLSVSNPDPPTDCLLINWDGNIEPDLAGYHVHRAQSTGPPYIVIGTVTTNSFLDCGLTEGQQYFYAVSAFNGDGYESSASNEGSGTVPIFGCLDPLATNYVPEATEDDGSCEYPDP